MSHHLLSIADTRHYSRRLRVRWDSTTGREQRLSKVSDQVIGGWIWWRLTLFVVNFNIGVIFFPLDFNLNIFKMHHIRGCSLSCRWSCPLHSFAFSRSCSATPYGSLGNLPRTAPTCGLIFLRLQHETTAKTDTITASYPEQWCGGPDEISCTH